MPLVKFPAVFPLIPILVCTNISNLLIKTKKLLIKCSPKIVNNWPLSTHDVGVGLRADVRRIMNDE